MNLLERSACLAFAATLGLALLAGCGGGGGGGGVTGGGGNNGGGGDNGGGGTSPLQTASDDLNGLLKQDTVSITDLADARDKFQDAVDADATSVPAKTGLALTQSALAFQRLAELFGEAVNALRSPDDEGSMQRLARRGTLHSLTGRGLDPTSAPVSPRDLFSGGSRQSGDDPTPEEVWQIMTEIEPELELALSVVNATPRSADALMIPDETGSKMIAFGQPERDALEATLYASLGLINFLKSWNLNPGAFNYEAAAQSTYGVSVDSFDPVTPDTYLPGGTFGKRQTDATQRLQKFKSYWLQAATMTRNAIDGVKQRGNGDFVLPANLFAPGALDAARASIPEFEAVLNGPVLVQDVEMWFDFYDVRINLAAWINNPPADLKAFAPDLILTRDDTTGSPEIAIEVDLGSYEDVTFGGLFPDGLPVESIEDRVDWLPWDSTRLDVAAWAFELFYFDYSL